MKTCIWVTTQFAGMHAWPEAPKVVAFLRTPHRHLFHVRVSFKVTDDDRQVEFFIAKARVETIIARAWPDGDLGSMSCEHIARAIASCLLHDNMPVLTVEVSEDGENGAILDLEIT